jgi:hypothetical protein
MNDEQTDSQDIDAAQVDGAQPGQNGHAPERTTPPAPRWRRAALVFTTVALAYAATSAGYLASPSPHFHFVDLAQSFLDGRLDTDTPRRRGGAAAQEGDPVGYQVAIDRATRSGSEGWNDWASYRVLGLRGGDEVRGVFPFKDTKGPRSQEFWTVGGESMVIDTDRDLATGCDPLRPAAKCDRVVYQVSFPPFPAVVMMPFVALIGFHIHDVVLTLLFGALSALLLLLWLDRMASEGLIDHNRIDRLWIVALFAFGTVAWYCAIRGAVWFTALTMGVTLHFAYLIAAERARRPLLAGALLALGVATRTPLLFGAIFLPLEALFPDGRWLGGRGRDGLRDAVRALALYAAPLALMGLTLAWYNWARWQNPLEFGHFYLLEGTRAPTRDFGLFSFHFLNHNLSAALTNLPKFSVHAPFVQITRHGLGILASTPALLAMFGTPSRHPAAVAAGAVDASGHPSDSAVRKRTLTRHLVIAVIAIATPALFYQNDGWQQFGYRFALDFWPALIGVFALRVGHLNRRVKALIVIAILIQLFGAITFGRLEQFYYD